MRKTKKQLTAEAQAEADRIAKDIAEAKAADDAKNALPPTQDELLKEFDQQLGDLIQQYCTRLGSTLIRKCLIQWTVDVENFEINSLVSSQINVVRQELQAAIKAVVVSRQRIKPLPRNAATKKQSTRRKASRKKVNKR